MSKTVEEKIKDQLIKQTKAYKYSAYCRVYEAEFKHFGSVNQNCRRLEVSKKSYYLWKKKHQLYSSKQIKTGLFQCLLPGFEPKINSNALYYLSESKRFFGIATGVNHIRKWIWKEFKVRISNQAIRRLKKKHPWTFPLLTQEKKKTSTQVNVRSDKVGKDYSTTRNKEKIGMDGTWFKDLVIGGKRTKVLGEMAYDWESKEIVAWGFSKSENTTIVKEVLRKLSDDYLGELGLESCLVQMDRGSANTSYEILTLEKEKSNFAISMSEAGFKHNSPTESLNRWIKERFYKTFGHSFTSIQNFIKTFALFVVQHNNFQTYLKTIELSKRF